MTKQVQRRRGSSSEHTSFTGAAGEISVNTTNNTMHVHDGSTAGGFESARSDLDNVSTSDITSGISGGTVATLTITSADINGGTLDNVTIGGSTAAAGTFTNITASGTINLNGATVSDGGTVTTVDINGGTLDNVTIGGTTAGAGTFTNITATGTINLNGATVSDGGTVTTVDIDGGSIDGATIGANSAAAGTFSTATVTGDLTVDTNTLYVDSTNNNVGIGENSSLLGKLHIKTADSSGSADSGADELVLENSGDAGMTILSGTANSGSIRFGDSDDNDNGIIIYNHGASPYMRFFVDASERMRIDSSGNVGVGTSSVNSASAGRTVLEVNGSSTALFHLSAGGSAKGQLYYSGSEFRINSLTADPMTFFTNGSERMRIDSSGKVGIGTTFGENIASSANKLAVRSDTGSTHYNIMNVWEHNNTSSGIEQRIGWAFGDDGGSEASFGLAGYIGMSKANSWNIDSTRSADMTFGTTGANSLNERMRISATSPALSIGKTTFGTAGQGFTVYGNTAPQCYFNKSQSGAVNGILFYYLNSYVGGLNYTNTGTSIATSSDERLKDNIENSDDAGAKIDAMQVRQFDWKSTGEHQEYGFVAQELEPVFAHAVHTDKEGDYKSVDYACLVPMLVKEIQSLRQRIADLENA